ncbi:MAG: hypothetical protein OXG67_12145 [bacterium]|nr:hypothetical protein [bacterium]
MSRRPVVDRPAVELPAYPGSAPIWDALLDLAGDRSQPEWTLIGGQMVMLHAAEHGRRSCLAGLGERGDVVAYCLDEGAFRCICRRRGEHPVADCEQVCR